MNRYTQRTQLHDCSDKSPQCDNELLIVEGDSASKSVLRLRDPVTQAVLPMQGKPMNARRRTAANVRSNPLFAHLIRCIDAGFDKDFVVQNVLYSRVALLFDPDADGIHCGVLMSLFFDRWMPGLIQQGRLHIIRAPLFEVTWHDQNNDRHSITAYTDEDLNAKRNGLTGTDVFDLSTKRFRGLGSFPGDLLKQSCLSPKTRLMHPVTPADVASMVRIFCPT